LENVLALARKYESTQVACKEKDTINNIFVKKEKKGGKATPSQPVQQQNATQSSTNANAKANQTGAKRPCNRCGEESTYEHRQNCPAKADTCTNCKKKGHRAVICHNGKRLTANGQVASASATAESGSTSDCQEFQAFKQHQRQQLQQRHHQQQQQQAEECAQINAEFGTWGPYDSCNVITQGVSNVNNLCRPTSPLFLNLKPVWKPTFRIQVLADTGATQSLISLSTATKHGCEIKETTICLSAANGTKIKVTGTTSLQVVEKGKRLHTIVTVVSQNVTQTIVGWKDLMAMGVISSDWPAMPQQEDKIDDKIHAADDNDEEKQLGKLKMHMLKKYSTVFSDTSNEKTITGTPMKIHLRDDIEITPQKCCVARALPVHQQAAATKLEQELEAAGIIQKVDKPTAWTSPGFFVPKPNGGVRLVTDYAGPLGLNSQILRPTQPFPAAHDIVQAILPSARYFATTDCVHGYFQLALDKESRDLTTFMLPSGRWQYLQGPMGLSATSDQGIQRFD
jgi:hypothetical protein